MHSFGEALQSGQLGPLLQQFNLPSDVSNAALKGDIEEFAKAMQEHVKTNKNTKKSTSGNNTNDDEKMES
jgi:26S proteasome regulatory subunit N13